MTGVVSGQQPEGYPAIPILQRHARTPLHLQLEDALRALIVQGSLRPGQRIPPSREWASHLGVSRPTVTRAYDALVAEGYLHATQGSGTTVSADLPDEIVLPPVPPTTAPEGGQPDLLSRRGERIAQLAVSHVPQHPRVGPLRAGLPATDQFPWRTWMQCANRAMNSIGYGELSRYADPAGLDILREQVAAHLATNRGVVCTADHVIVVNGSQQALALAANVLLDEGDAAWIEEPCRAAARAAFDAAGIRLSFVPVDDHGMDVDAVAHSCRDGRLAYVSPSCHFPLGVTMTLARRLALLEWADRTGAWILEDDYDSDFRYSGRSLPALQGLDRGRKVVYVGTFSRSLFPGLRLGYIVSPAALVPAFVAAKSLVDRHSAVLDQATTALFMRDGHFAHHLRRMRALYRERRAAVMDALGDGGDLFTVQHSDAGMHVLVWLSPVVDSDLLRRRMLQIHLDVAMLEDYYAQIPRRGLILGFANTDAGSIRRACRQLATLIGDSVARRGPALWDR